MTRRRLLLVGEAPSRTGDASRPLTGRCGRYLAAVLGIGQREYLGRTRRVNVLDAWPGSSGKGSKFPLHLARPAAALLSWEWPSEQAAVVMGKRAAAAFGLKATDFLCWYYGNHPYTGRRLKLAVLPHPSGVNRWWNEARNRTRARRFLRRAYRQATS